MNKIIILFVIIAVAVTFLVWWQFAREAPKPVTNFQECVAAGNPIMESYPRQCRDGDQTFTEVIIETFTQTKGPVNYSIDMPLGWFPYENESTVIFTQDPNLKIPANTEGFAIGPHFYITLYNFTDIPGITTYEEWLDVNGMTEKSPLFIESESVNRNGYEMKRVVKEAAGSEGRVLQYVYFVDIQRIIVLGQYPYNPESSITKVFEAAAETFLVPDNQGGSGILPFDSGARGRVFLGPNCPAAKEEDESCGDKPYVTTVQVIAVGSPKSSPFAVTETNKEGYYQVMLPPGEYSLQAIGETPFPQCSWEIINVEPSTIIEVDLFCDTGIR